MQMQSAMCLGSIFGPFLIILGFWMLFYRSNLTKVITSMKSTPGILYVAGVINLIVGLAVISQYNVWMWQLPLTVTIFGWVVFIRGLLAFFFPQMLFHKNVTSASYLQLKGIVVLIWGLLMCWFTFWM